MVAREVTRRHTVAGAERIRQRPGSGAGGGQRSTVTVVGLGPAGPQLTSPGAVAAIRSARRVFLRTKRHPAAESFWPAEPFPAAESFDSLYETLPTFDAVYEAIVDRLVAEAAEGPGVVYAVPGSPLVAERTVELLRQRPEVALDVLPSLSFMDLAWERLEVDPLSVSVRLVDAERFSVDAAGERGPLLVAQCWSRTVLSDVKLAVDEPPTAPVTLLHHLGLPDELRVEVAWQDIDRTVEADHLTSLWVPALSSPSAAEFSRLEELVRTLRERCPWDAEQTHSSLARHLREETYEVLEAIAELGEEGEGQEDLCEELGDLLFQVLFHARLAAEQGWFDLADVAKGVHDKLRRRHPHVFGGEVAADAAAVASAWEQRKHREKGRSSFLDGIPASLPALAYAQQLRERADRLLPASATGGGEPAEAAFGELLFSIVWLAGDSGVDAEEALRRAAALRAADWAEKERMLSAGPADGLREP